MVTAVATVSITAAPTTSHKTQKNIISPQVASCAIQRAGRKAPSRPKWGLERDVHRIGAVVPIVRPQGSRRRPRAACSARACARAPSAARSRRSQSTGGQFACQRLSARVSVPRAPRCTGCCTERSPATSRQVAPLTTGAVRPR